MSIASEISRISGNISNSFTALAEMGVAVPANATSNDLPALIRAIPTATIVQVAGSSTENIMSQKAVTDLVNNKSPFVSGATVV